MSMLIEKDNSKIDRLADHPIVKELANKDLSVLDKENFIVFPQQLADSEDLDHDNYVFQQKNNETWTCNIVGIISDGTDEIRIKSRFTKEGKEDFFLRYMMEQVLNYNVVTSQIGSSKEMSYYDLIVFLFPYYLDKALIKGMYKEYVQRQYNDANIKGPIDIARHIKRNMPFMGRVAYNTREFSYDNNITELIRHTVEKIGHEYEFLLVGNENTKENVRTIKRITTRYDRLDREAVIQNNILNPVKSGYFEEYAELQRICIQIITEEKTGFGDDEDKVNGIIIDVAWLWEEYIWKVTGWKHYGRKKELATLQVFKERGTDSQQHRYPDFEFCNIPIDTKYKRNIQKRNDYNQMITYIHIMESSKGGFLQPTDVDGNNLGYAVLGKLFGGGELFTYKFFIPQEYASYSDFMAQIQESEKDLKNLTI